MIVNEALGGWLLDPERQLATRRRMEDLAGEIGRLPAFAALEAGLPAAEAEGAEAVLALARTFLGEEAAVRACADAMIAAAAADPFCRPPFRCAANQVRCGLLLFSRPALTIQLAAMSADAIAVKRSHRNGGASICFNGQRSVFRFLRGGGATLSIWRRPPVGADFTADGAGPCVRVGRRRLVDGDTLEVDGRSETFIVDHARSDLVYLEAETGLGASPLATEHDAGTLELIGASGTDDAGSRTQMMLSLLRLLDRRDAAPLFAAFARNGHFYARWQAMREFLALDAEAALPHLEAMAAEDPHDEVRAAAAESLAALFADEPESKEAGEPCPA